MDGFRIGLWVKENIRIMGIWLEDNDFWCGPRGRGIRTERAPLPHRRQVLTKEGSFQLTSPSTTRRWQTCSRSVLLLLLLLSTTGGRRMVYVCSCFRHVDCHRPSYFLSTRLHTVLWFTSMPSKDEVTSFQKGLIWQLYELQSSLHEINAFTQSQFTISWRIVCSVDGRVPERRTNYYNLQFTFFGCINELWLGVILHLSFVLFFFCFLHLFEALFNLRVWRKIAYILYFSPTSMIINAGGPRG